MSVETQSSWGAAVRGMGVTFREFFDQNVKSFEMGWDPVVKTIRDDGAQATFSGKTGTGTLTRFAEGAAVPMKNRYKLYDTAFSHDQYGGQLEVTRKNLMNRMFNEKFSEFKDLAISARVTLSKAPAQIFNRAFTSGNGVTNGIYVTTYNDGKALASTAHPRVDGGTAQSNASSTSIAFSEANLETGRLALLKQLQDDGTPIAFSGPMYLVVPIALEKTAKIVTGSELRSGTANNDKNIYNGGAIQVLSSIWLDATSGGSDTQWQLVAPDVAKLYLVMRNGPDMDQSVNSNTKSTLFDVILDFSEGSADWHGVWFSKGDATAYSS